MPQIVRLRMERFLSIRPCIIAWLYTLQDLWSQFFSPAGSLACQRKDGRWFLAGITSWGISFGLFAFLMLDFLYCKNLLVFPATLIYSFRLRLPRSEQSGSLRTRSLPRQMGAERHAAAQAPSRVGSGVNLSFYANFTHRNHFVIILL